MKITLAKHTMNVSLNEVSHGPVEWKYALIDPETGIAVTPFFKCRDYLNDIFWSYFNNMEMSIYGYTAKPEYFKDLLSKDTFSLAIRTQDKVGGTKKPMTPAQLKGLDKTQELFSKGLGFKVYPTELCEEGIHAIVTVDKQWGIIPHIQSMLLYVLRLGINYNPEEDFMTQFGSGNSSKFISLGDQVSFKKVKEVMEKALKGEKFTGKYVSEDNANKVHNYYGVVTYSQLETA